MIIIKNQLTEYQQNKKDVNLLINNNNKAEELLFF